MKMFNVTIRTFLDVFNFISRMVYCVENGILEDSYNRRYTKSYTCLREDYIIDKWLKENEIDKETISGMFYYNTERVKYNLIFSNNDKDKRYNDYVVIEEGIFSDSIKNVFIFLPISFTDFDTKEKIQTLQYIFYDIFISGPSTLPMEIREKSLKICELFACLLYVAPDYYDDRVKDYIEKLMSVINNDLYISFNTMDPMNIASIDLILENFVYGG